MQSYSLPPKFTANKELPLGPCLLQTLPLQHPLTLAPANCTRAVDALQHLLKPINRFSWGHCWVPKENGQFLVSACSMESSQNVSGYSTLVSFYQSALPLDFCVVTPLLTSPISPGGRAPGMSLPRTTNILYFLVSCILETPFYILYPLFHFSRPLGFSNVPTMYQFLSILTSSWLLSSFTKITRAPVIFLQNAMTSRVHVLSPHVCRAAEAPTDT